VRAYYIKCEGDLFLGNDEAIFVFMTRELAQARLDDTEAAPQENMRIVPITIEEVQ
jgi:hypothetical protein